MGSRVHMPMRDVDEGAREAEAIFVRVDVLLVALDPERPMLKRFN